MGRLDWRLRWVVGMGLLADGALDLAFGSGYARFLVGLLPERLRGRGRWLAERPSWQIRASGVAKTALGMLLLGPTSGT